MKNLSIVFMGTPDFAVASLDAILKAGYPVKGVITAPDRPAGRGRKLRPSAVKQYALAHDLKVMQPTNLKDPVFLDELQQLQADVFVVVAFRMLPEAVWSMPPRGTFNLHASLLPEYRGAAPINWAIIRGEKQTGVTTFFIDEKIDTGAIIDQRKTEIGQNTTAGELHDTLMDLGAGLVTDTLEMIGQGTVQTKEQDKEAEVKTAPKIDRESTRIDWNKPVAEIHNLIRGMSPYPTAWTYLVNKGEEIPVKIFTASIAEGATDTKPGQVFIDNRTMKVSGKDGWLELYEIQMPGKRKMSVQDVLNGIEIEKSAKMR
ncbi:methionyl-tRNA formyltransferase [Robertkochia aurantiaca]|uniref:methionyl-tRNA formyltransferase n=1 Tax=Robertkochia aurantiaca TaxID=2873700 RepID=UPI001CCFBCB3|nr:methionyl-tRNA formyltransferase [Robertkochia sp. 3YJGBD-33]